MFSYHNNSYKPISIKQTIRISDTKDLGEALKKEFGGDLVAANSSGEILLRGAKETTKAEVLRSVSKYYIDTLGCKSHPKAPGLSNNDGYESVAITCLGGSQREIIVTSTIVR